MSDGLVNEEDPLGEWVRRRNAGECRWCGGLPSLEATGSTGRNAQCDAAAVESTCEVCGGFGGAGAGEICGHCGGAGWFTSCACRDASEWREAGRVKLPPGAVSSS